MPVVRRGQRLQCGGFVEVKHGVELLCKRGDKVMARAFAVRQIEHADRALEHRFAPGLGGGVVPAQEEAIQPGAATRVFVAVEIGSGSCGDRECAYVKIPGVGVSLTKKEK